MGEDERIARGREVEKRRLALVMTKSELARRAHMDRATVDRIEEGAAGVRDTSLAAVERALDEFEYEISPPGPPDPETNTVRFVVRGVYGAEALVVEGPMDKIAELEESVDRIMRRIRGNSDEG